MKAIPYVALILPFLCALKVNKKDQDSALKKLRAQHVNVLEDQVAKAQQLSKIGLCDAASLMDFETDLILLKARYTQNSNQREELFSQAILRMRELVEFIESSLQTAESPPKAGTRRRPFDLDALEELTAAKSKLIEIEMLALANSSS